MRIVSGRFKGRALHTPPGEATRPTSDRARQAVFNILEHAPWSAGLHDQDVSVQVANGRATLTGIVDTWLDRQLAAQEAREAGAYEVNNHLHVLNANPRTSPATPHSHGIEA